MFPILGCLTPFKHSVESLLYWSIVENENQYDDMIDIMEHLHKYICSITSHN